ncbi:MAG: hypothetical protein ACREBS_05175 [Nitrososphaerales archaeon]
MENELTTQDMQQKPDVIFSVVHKSLDFNYTLYFGFGRGDNGQLLFLVSTGNWWVVPSLGELAIQSDLKVLLAQNKFYFGSYYQEYVEADGTRVFSFSESDYWTLIDQLTDYLALPTYCRGDFLANFAIDTFEDSRMLDVFGIFTCYVDWTLLAQLRLDRRIGKTRLGSEEARIRSELEECRENLVIAFEEDQLICQPQLLCM